MTKYYCGQWYKHYEACHDEYDQLNGSRRTSLAISGSGDRCHMTPDTSVPSTGSKLN